MEQKITIIHFVHTLYGGVANVAAELINYQHALGYKTVLAYANYDPAIESQIAHEVEKKHVWIAPIPGANMLFGMNVVGTYREYKKNHSDELVIVHVHNVQTLGCFGNWKQIPIICTLHGFNHPRKSVRKLFSDFLYCRTLSKLLKYDKKITAVSKAITDAEECKKIAGRDKIRVIHNFTKIDINDKKVHTSFRVGHVGDLSYEKGWDTLWNAYLLLPEEERNNITLYAAGKEAEYTAKSLKREAEHHNVTDHVHYEGYVYNAKKDFISKLDLLVLASRNEGFGLVQIEAMGYGIPVLGRDTGGICEVLQDGYNGFVITGEEDLSQRIRQLYHDKELYLRLSENAKKTYQEKFTEEVIMMEYKKVYDELLLDCSR